MMAFTTEVERLEGVFAVRAALLSGYRRVHVVYMDHERSDRNATELWLLARERGVRVERVERRRLDDQAQSTSHGGVVALAAPRALQSLEALVQDAARPFVVMLDGVEDPYNFGQAVRSLYAAGAHGLVLRRRNWLSAANLVARSSAGATELIPTAVVEGPQEAAGMMRRHGLIVACAARQRAVSIYEARLEIALFLVIGGERRGVSRSFLRQADLRLRIPYARQAGYSLGTAAASAIIAAEVMRQRQARDSGMESWSDAEALDRHRKSMHAYAADAVRS